MSHNYGCKPSPASLFLRWQSCWQSAAAVHSQRLVKLCKHPKRDLPSQSIIFLAHISFVSDGNVGASFRVLLLKLGCPQPSKADFESLKVLLNSCI